MGCGVGGRHGSDPALLWLWLRPVATAPIRPLVWEPPHAAEAAQRNSKKTKIKKKNEIMPSAATGMDLVIIRLSEVSQTKKDKFPMVSNYMWNLIKMLQNNLFKNITKLTDSKSIL